MAIWVFWLGYFLCYVPYTILIKGTGLGSWQLLAGATLGSLSALIVVWTTMGWWKRFQWRLPPRVETIQVTRASTEGPYRTILDPLEVQKMVPGPINPAVWSGLATIGIILSTTMGFALSGASAVFMAILMKVGTLVLARIIDALTKRTVRPAAKWALVLAIMAALVTLIGKSLSVTIAALAINLVYLGAYAVKLRLVADRKGDMDFLITDQAVAVIGAAAVVMAMGIFFTPVTIGFAMLARWDVWVIGILSQGTGIFGSLMFLAPQEHSYCVPLNRSGSILATLCGTFLQGHQPTHPEMIGAGLVLGAIGVLARKGGPARSIETHTHVMPVRKSAPAHPIISLPIRGGLPSEG